MFNTPRFALVLPVLILLIAYPAFGQVKIIFDTDFGGDADDLGALVMLHNLHGRGECELLAVMSWSTEQYVIHQRRCTARGRSLSTDFVRTAGSQRGHRHGWAAEEYRGFVEITA